MKGQDYQTYEIYYREIIDIVARGYAQTNNLIYLPSAKDDIWKAYLTFNTHCKTQYMTSTDKLLDRHKVVACYMYAIIKADVLKDVEAIKMGKTDDGLMNEQLALCVGFTILRAMILDEVAQLTEDHPYKKELAGVFEGEFDFPNTYHGGYRENLKIQLFQTKKEGNYNILSLAETMYLIECVHMLKHGIPENVFRADL